ncbi:triphosphoribosyl-dephospho-CoA synthase CitG [Buttiauxella sp. A2-C2_NF]|uniref:triphosphoribosyl-dephospho-CoA synthase CitG n=1 Tax=Buttiauxella TaxID=82976 RepID=UPI00106071AD|nr:MULTISPECIES: triphosphoribosyl-dephospho-CoA synthase CitG [Buttiauxella]MCE0826125.1 triphosphoribosyl-dephospho-CoA synthase CitG [Buttiauxella ferragutiae]TDN52265.1 triphosphoribosyl-dephospho-CoA synthase [Buttiauxella sp. JUb87]
MSEASHVEICQYASENMRAEEVVNLVRQALLKSAHLTPKPGLLDIRNTGSHQEVNLTSYKAGVQMMMPWIKKFFVMGHDSAALKPQQVLMMLRPVGIACETDILQVNGEVNTHRGAVFAFGLLSAAIGRLTAQNQPIEHTRLCHQVARLCRNLVERELASKTGKPGKSETQFLRYGFTGARGEAESGFRTVRTLALPTFQRVIHQTGDTQLALLQTLLHLMAWNDDSHLVSRGGLEGLYFVQQQAQYLLWRGGVLAEGGIEELQKLDDELIERNLSPLGSADLLAVTWFLSQFPAGPIFIN